MSDEGLALSLATNWIMRSAFAGVALSKYRQRSVASTNASICVFVFTSSLMQSLVEPSPHDIVCVERTAKAAVLARDMSTCVLGLQRKYVAPRLMIEALAGTSLSPLTGWQSIFAGRVGFVECVCCDGSAVVTTATARMATISPISHRQTALMNFMGYLLLTHSKVNPITSYGTSRGK